MLAIDVMISRDMTPIVMKHVYMSIVTKSRSHTYRNNSFMHFLFLHLHTVVMRKPKVSNQPIQQLPRYLVSKSVPKWSRVPLQGVVLGLG